MNVRFEEMLTQVTGFLKTEAGRDTVIGQKFGLGEYTCVPVSLFSYGSGEQQRAGSKEAESIN